MALGLQLNKFDRAILMYKVMKGLSPVNLKGRFITRSEISAYLRRNKFDLDIS